jgi:hypothetical protein
MPTNEDLTAKNGYAVDTHFSLLLLLYFDL